MAPNVGPEKQQCLNVNIVINSFLFCIFLFFSKFKHRKLEFALLLSVFIVRFSVLICRNSVTVQYWLVWIAYRDYMSACYNVYVSPRRWSHLIFKLYYSVFDKLFIIHLTSSSWNLNLSFLRTIWFFSNNNTAVNIKIQNLCLFVFICIFCVFFTLFAFFCFSFLWFVYIFCFFLFVYIFYLHFQGLFTFFCNIDVCFEIQSVMTGKKS